MSAVFADTFFFLAILNRSDPAHRHASELSRSLRQGVIGAGLKYQILGGGSMPIV